MATPENISARAVLQYIADQYKIAPAAIVCGKRWYPEVEARYSAFWLMYKYVYNGFAEAERFKKIAGFFHLKNARIVRYAIRKIERNWMKSDKRYIEKIKIIEQKYFAL